VDDGWDNADFGFFEEATPAPAVATPKTAQTTRMEQQQGHKPAPSMSKNPPIPTPTIASGSGKSENKNEEEMFKDIIGILPDLSYMLR